MADTICTECHKAICKCDTIDDSVARFNRQFMFADDGNLVPRNIRPAVLSITRTERVMDELQKKYEHAAGIREEQRRLYNGEGPLSCEPIKPGAVFKVKNAPRIAPCHCNLNPAGDCDFCAFDIFNFWAQIAIAGLLQVAEWYSGSRPPCDCPFPQRRGSCSEHNDMWFAQMFLIC